MIWALPLLPALAGLALWARPPARSGAAAAAVAALAALAALLLAGTEGHFFWSDAIGLRASLPPIAATMAVAVPLVALPILIFAAAERPAGLPRLLGLLLVFVGGMELIVIAADLVTLLIGWEIVGACSWALIGHRWREAAPTRSAAYAFVATRTGDLGLFVALFATFAATGGTDYEALGTLEGPSGALVAGGILVAAAAKAGQIPFAPWLFRAMDGPTPVSALLHSAAMVAAGVYLLARLHPQIGAAPGFAPAAMAVGLATAILGGIAALRQMHAKKLLAGSTSAQMGLMIATVGAGFPGVSILHLIVHAATKAALFVTAGIARGATESFDLRGMRLGRALPWVSGLCALAALSLAAVPPLSGGWSKEEMVKALEQAGPVIAAAGIVAGGLSAAYSARFWLMVGGPGEAREATVPNGALAALAALAGTVLLLSALWWPSAHTTGARLVGAELPHGSRAGLIASLTAVALGLLAGIAMARRSAEAPERDWLGLPLLVDAGLVRPFDRLARLAARIDDAAIDGQRAGLDAAGGLVGGTVRATRALTCAAGTGGERLADLLPAGGGRLAGLTGQDLRRLQSGLAHHYYAILIAGAALTSLVLILGG